MRTELTSQEIESYRNDGFLAVSDFLTPDELQQWREAVDEAVESRKEYHLPGGRKLGGGSDYYSRIFIQRINLWKDNEKVRQVVIDPRIGKLICELEGIDGVHLLDDQALIKEPWGNPTSWHRDVPGWEYHSVHASQLWVALDEATLQNGCLYFMPGSHRNQVFQSKNIDGNLAGIFQIFPEFANQQPLTTPVPAGGCVFFNALVLHAANANMSPRPRRALAFNFMPVGSHSSGNQGIIPDEKFAKMKVGDLIDDPDEYPLLFLRTQEERLVD